jgi:hypothetical protein
MVYEWWVRKRDRVRDISGGGSSNIYIWKIICGMAEK